MYYKKQLLEFSELPEKVKTLVEQINYIYDLTDAEYHFGASDEEIDATKEDWANVIKTGEIEGLAAIIDYIKFCKEDEEELQKGKNPDDFNPRAEIPPVCESILNDLLTVSFSWTFYATRNLCRGIRYNAEFDYDYEYPEEADIYGFYVNADSSVLKKPNEFINTEFIIPSIDNLQVGSGGTAFGNFIRLKPMSVEKSTGYIAHESYRGSELTDRTIFENDTITIDYSDGGGKLFTIDNGNIPEELFRDDVVKVSIISDTSNQ